jgi:predicted metal-dependent hydrolase
MEEFMLFFLSVSVFFIIINKVYKKGDIISIKSELDGQIYLVRKLPDAKNAAKKLAEINKKVLRLISVLDTTKKGVQDLIDNYNPRALSETLPGSKYTSYSVNKGEKISVCIRSVDDESFIDDNTILFVVIHELSHVMTEEVGHTPLFWDNMRYLLEEGEKVGIYTPIDYSKVPKEYCGMEINTTPYDFSK